MRIENLTEEHAQAIAGWRYEFPYEWYDTASDPGRIELFANPARRDGLRAVVDDDGELIGFYYFEPKPPDLDYGLGLRPDLVGRGLGLDFFLAGLAFARRRYRPDRVCLHVAAFNERARRVYERAGFRVVSSHVRKFERFGEVPFLTMADT